jgi:hypothetical protein
MVYFFMTTFVVLLRAVMEPNLASKLQGCYPESSQSLLQKPKRTHNTYRPTHEQPFLEFRLNEWLRLEHLADPFRSVRPPESDASTCGPKTVQDIAASAKISRDCTLKSGDEVQVRHE